MAVFFKSPDAWVGDCIPFWENGLYYVFYLHDPRIRKGEYEEETTWHLVTTRDCLNFEYHGTAIAKGAEDRPNKNIFYTGSVIKGTNGIYYAFYTAFNENYPFEGQSMQSVMAACGTDPFHLETEEPFILRSDDVIYERFDWRDPFVFWNNEEKCY